MANDKRHLDYSTLAVRAGFEPTDLPYMPITEPLVMTSTFQQSDPGVFTYNYGRCGNPNRTNLEKRLAELEGARFAAAFPSGVSVVFAIGSMFSPGAHFVVSNDLYGGTMKCFGQMETRRQMNIDYLDLTLGAENLKQFVRKDTKLMWFETPTNPTLSVVDIRAVCEAAKSIAKDIVIVIDNTFLTSYFQRPLELGATVSMYSLTKYVNGHADVVMGAAVTNCPQINEFLHDMQEVNGLCPSPFDCWQVSRGSKTMALRMEQHNRNSLRIAQYLETHPYVVKVNHPLLESHASYEVTRRQAKGHSGIMSFAIRGDLEDVKKFLSSLKVITLAASLGGVETLIASPALMIHDMISQEKRDKMGITDNLIRLSVGIENANDLIRDIQQALETVFK